jgi:hypothetical protein
MFAQRTWQQPDDTPWHVPYYEYRGVHACRETGKKLLKHLQPPSRRANNDDVLFIHCKTMGIKFHK